MPAAQRFFLFVAISAVLWIGFVPIYHAAFAWAEFVPGANWVYLPHGLRMMLVLLFGLAGALGFTLGASLLAMTILSSTLLPPAGIPAVVDISLALVPGLAAWLAAVWTLKDWPGRYLTMPLAAGVTGLDGRRLILLAFVSAVLNAAGHAAVWGLFAAEATPAEQRFIAMFVGDFLGALLLLYTLRGLLIYLSKYQKGSGFHGGTTR